MINREIKSKKVRLIKDNSNEIVNTKDALMEAENLGLDLICINKGDIPVCKIGNYSKFLYEQKKKEKENKKKQKIVETKEIKINDETELNDLKTKAKLIDKFLKNGNKVKLSIRYKGRMIRNIDNGPEKLNHLTDLLTETYVVDAPCKTIGNTVSMTIVQKH